MENGLVCRMRNTRLPMSIGTETTNIQNTYIQNRLCCLEGSFQRNHLFAAVNYIMYNIPFFPFDFCWFLEKNQQKKISHIHTKSSTFYWTNQNCYFWSWISMQEIKSSSSHSILCPVSSWLLHFILLIPLHCICVQFILHVIAFVSTKSKFVKLISSDERVQVDIDNYTPS